MVCQLLLYLVEIVDLHLDFGRVSKKMGSKILMSTTYNPQNDGKSEITIQTLEDMVRSCIINFSGTWDEHLLFVEFVYNNSYCYSIQMEAFESLYGTPCRTPT